MLSIITLNVHELHFSIKRYRVTEWVKENNNKTQQETAYKKLTLPIKKHTD
jgi:hypothetical protein